LSLSEKGEVKTIILFIVEKNSNKFELKGADFILENSIPSLFLDFCFDHRL